MGISARRLRSLQRAYDSAHDLAFDRTKRPIPTRSFPPNPQHAGNPASIASSKPRIEVLDERFRAAIQKEFAKLGLN